MRDYYDICVAGFWYGSNYGSLLNGYAEYVLLKNFGKKVLMLQKPGAENGDEEINSGHNVRFIHNYYSPDDISPIYSYSDLGKLNDICDCFCAGSDQIWNYNLSFHENLYLPFVNEDKKLISFATSFGHKRDKVPDEAKPRIRSYLQRYNAISVREQFDVDILRNNYGINGTLVFEPVFCIDKKYYEQLAEHSTFSENEPYLLTYILDPTPEKTAAIRYYGGKLGLKVVNILNGVERVWERNKELLGLPNIVPNVGAEDFLKAFMKASYVITDSFHGSAFSIIFNKSFLAIGNYGRGYERFIDLLGRLKLTNRLVSDPKNIPHDEKLLVPIDYTETNKIIKTEAARTVEWFKQAVETPKEKMRSVIIPHNTVAAKLDSKMCMGCSACVNICPKAALTLKPDEHGYYRSSINYNKCVGCGLCTKICPAISLPENKNNNPPELYEFIASNEKILYNSSSGGIFPLLAAEAFKMGGVVVGAAWRNDFTVEHIMIDNSDDLYKLQKSKYLQSWLGNGIYTKTKEKLEQGVFVLFSGCPCQIAGLKAFLGKDYDNLIMVDLLCGNSPSSTFFKKYIEEDFPIGLEKYEFRHKVQGWNWDCTTTTTTNGVVSVRRGAKQDNYQRVYHNHTMCPPHCEKCRYQAVPRFGDITIGDFWGIGSKDTVNITKNGTSAVLLNNDKGKQFFFKVPLNEVYVRNNVPLAWLGGNGYAINGSHNYCSPNRDLFYEAVNLMPFSKAVNWALKPNHGIYKEASLLDYDPKALCFIYDDAIWEQGRIGDVTMLTTKKLHPPLGKYCALPIPRHLKKENKYIFKIRFKINTDAPVYNFHIKDSGSSLFQIIFTHKVTPENKNQWIEVEKEFIPDFEYYDEFMIGASQLSGENRYIAIDYIRIEEG